MPGAKPPRPETRAPRPGMMKFCIISRSQIQEMAVLGACGMDAPLRRLLLVLQYWSPKPRRTNTRACEPRSPS